jgi:hypothetical protein
LELAANGGVEPEAMGDGETQIVEVQKVIKVQN